MNCRSAIGHVNDEDEKKLWTVSYSGARRAHGCRRVPAALMPVAALRRSDARQHGSAILAPTTREEASSLEEMRSNHRSMLS